MDASDASVVAPNPKKRRERVLVPADPVFDLRPAQHAFPTRLERRTSTLAEIVADPDSVLIVPFKSWSAISVLLYDALQRHPLYNVPIKCTTSRHGHKSTILALRRLEDICEDCCTMDSDGCGCALESAAPREPSPEVSKLLSDLLDEEMGVTSTNKTAVMPTLQPPTQKPPLSLLLGEAEPEEELGLGVWKSTPQTFERTCLVRCAEGSYIVIPRKTVCNKSIFACVLGALAKAELMTDEEDVGNVKFISMCELEGSWRSTFVRLMEEESR